MDDTTAVDLSMNLVHKGQDETALRASLLPLLRALTNSSTIDQIYPILKEIKSIISSMPPEPQIMLTTQEVQQLTKKIELDATYFNLFGITRNLDSHVYQFDLNIRKFLISLSLNIANTETDNSGERKAELAFDLADLDSDGSISFRDLTEMMAGFNSFNGLCFDEDSIKKVCMHVYKQINYTTEEQDISKKTFVEFISNLRRESFHEKRAPEKKAQKPAGFWGKVGSALSIERSSLPAFFCWMILNLCASAYYWTQDRFGFYQRSITRQMAGQINLNSTILLLTISKNFQRAVHHTSLRKVFPIHKMVAYHRFLALYILVTGTIHTIFHLGGTFPRIASMTLDELNEKVAYHQLTGVPTYTWLVFHSIPGWSGICLEILMIVLVVMTIAKIRHKKFEAFWYSHHLYIAIYVLLAIHGMQELAAPHIFQFFFAVPGAIFIFEKLAKLYRYFVNRGRAISIRLLSSGVIELVVPRPSSFDYRSGQYCSLNIPRIRFFQWHPFTISSSPTQNNITFHISPVGDWTNELAELAKANLTGNDLPTVIMDGPFGTPTEQFNDYKNVMLICSGVGATPFASVLRELLHRVQNDKENLKIETLDFYWVNRKSSQLTWLVTLFQGLLREQFGMGSNFMKINLYFTGEAAMRTDFRSLFLWNAIEQLKKRGELKAHCYCSNVYTGRPQWDKIFKEKSEANDGATEIGVFLCGNKAMGAEVEEKCKKYSTNLKTFKFKEEVF